jgi:hypothetical protein
MIDVEELAIRSFDEPLAADDLAALRVWGDQLEAAGDPRGGLIAMEHEIRAQPRRRRELARATIAHAGALLGKLGPLVESSRALEVDWRSGRLYAVFLDTRHLAKRAKLPPEALVEMLLRAPAAASLRRLHVRVRYAEQIDPVVVELLHSPARDLEEIVILVGVRPTSLNGLARRGLAETFPDLRLLAIQDRITPVPTRGDAVAIARAMPAEPNGRILLGRALTSDDAALRAEAARRIAELGPRAFMFVDTLLALLEPRLTTPQAAFASCLGSVGEAARIAIPRLATITGRVTHYDLDTRRAAGAAIAALT